MDDFISRQAAIQITIETGAWETKKRLRELPAAAVKPVVETQFVESVNPDLTGILVCSACWQFGFSPTRYPEGKKYNYCPMCGAKVTPFY